MRTWREPALSLTTNSIKLILWEVMEKMWIDHGGANNCASENVLDFFPHQKSRVGRDNFTTEHSCLVGSSVGLQLAINCLVRCSFSEASFPISLQGLALPRGVQSSSDDSSSSQLWLAEKSLVLAIPDLVRWFYLFKSMMNPYNST